MKAGISLIALALSFAGMSAAPPAEPAAEPNGPSASSSVRGRIMELLKQDAIKPAPKPTEVIAPPFAANVNNHPVTEGVLELDPITVTQKKPIELPLRTPKLTLENFFHGDGTIAQSADKRISLSAGPERRGLAAIKFNLKF